MLIIKLFEVDLMDLVLNQKKSRDEIHEEKY